MTAVLAIPFLAGDLRPCVESIDADVRLVIIDNSPGGEAWESVPDDAHVIEMPRNIGYTATVNLIIKTFPKEPYWLFANHDVTFAPGDLQRLIGATESGEWGWVGINDWRAFGLTAETVDRVGLWDEHFFVYCSDADYERRCELAGVRWGTITGETSHVGSAVIKGYPRYCSANARSYPQEVAYYCQKWGVSGVRAAGGFTTPFDAGGSLADGTQPSLSRLRQLSWD